MPKLEYFLVCESMATDRETNRVSLFNVIEDFRLVPKNTPQAPHVVAQVVAVSCWNREDGDEDTDFQAMLRIHAPNQESQAFPLNFQMERPRYRLSMRLQGMPDLEPGKMIFELLLNGEHIATHTVNVFPPKDESQGEADSETAADEC